MKTSGQSRKALHRHVAFLRAINTPPRYVQMERIRSVFRALGFDNVTSVIASGNVVFDSTHSTVSADRIEAALLAKLGFDVPTFLRTSAAVTNIAQNAPFPTDHGHIEVSLLHKEPEPDAVRALEASATDTDRIAVHGTEVYRWHQGNRAGSVHNEATVARILGMTTTRRTLRTINRIIDAHLPRSETSPRNTSA